jgi:hypothetical protein
MGTISSLRPNVTREEAVREFSSGMAGLLSRAAAGPLRSVVDAYLPFRVFRVEIRNAGKVEEHFFGLDGITGTLDLYEFKRPPEAEDLVRIESRNCLPGSLNALRAESILVDKVRRLLFSRGFFRIRELRIRVTLLGEVHVPYWLGFRGRDERARMSVLDAVRRRPEGAKAREIFHTWLAA